MIDVSNELCSVWLLGRKWHTRDVHVLARSVPTRRSSDLAAARRGSLRRRRHRRHRDSRSGHRRSRGPPHRAADARADARAHRTAPGRLATSEEHTSALQPLLRNSYPIFRLKKTTHTDTLDIYTNSHQNITSAEQNG